MMPLKIAVCHDFRFIQIFALRAEHRRQRLNALHLSLYGTAHSYLPCFSHRKVRAGRPAATALRDKETRSLQPGEMN